MHHTTADTYETHSDTLYRVISNAAEKVVYFRRDASFARRIGKSFASTLPKLT